MYLAHIVKRKDEVFEQTLKEHVENTAKYASNNLKTVGLYHTGFVAGMLHDLGKCKDEYNSYLLRALNGEKVHRGEVNHTFAGVIWILKNYHNENNDGYEKATSEIIAYAIGSHHGMFDILSENGENGFEHRLEFFASDDSKNNIFYSESVDAFFNECTTIDSIREEISAAVIEIKKVIEYIKSDKYPKSKNICPNEKNYAIGVICRLVLSALIDADHQDTDMFMNQTDYKIDNVDLKTMWDNELNSMERKLKCFPKSKIGDARTEISNQCRCFAANKEGIYRLSVPTGSGKTLATLRFALAHAAEKEKKRIFFVIPLLSVIEQNAKVIHQYINDDEIILEHHSNVIFQNDEVEELNKYEVLASNWKSPIVITTMVQLLNTFFEGKTTAVRRFQALQNSIIIIDEIQTIPDKMISMFNCTLNFLAYYCHTTIVLCSATQPELSIVDHSIQYAEKKDMVPYDVNLWNVFRRTNFVDKCKKYGYEVDEVQTFVLELMENSDSLLIVCNTRKEVQDLFCSIKQRDHSLNEPFCVVQLSTSMCMQHRLDTMKIIEEALEMNKRIVVVSTQLMEAGIDLSFQSVIRICAGLDNVAQAGGRCNRNGEWEENCNVYIINLANENLKNLRSIRLAKDSMFYFLNEFKNSPDKFDDYMLSDKSISTFYQHLYKNNTVNARFDYPAENYHSNLFRMLSDNEDFVQNIMKPMDLIVLKQAFKMAGKEFQVFDNDTFDVIVPYNQKACDIIADLYSQKAKYDINYLRNKLDEAQPYTISLFSFQIDQLFKQGGLHEVDKQPFYTVLETYYNTETGFSIDGYYNI